MGSIHLIDGLKDSFSACRDDTNNDFDQADKGSYDETGGVTVKESCSLGILSFWLHH